jgi:hypothetical protein
MAVNLFVGWLFDQKLPGQPSTWNSPNFRILSDQDALKVEWGEFVGDLEAEWFDICMALLKATVFSDRFMVPAFGSTVKNYLVTMDTIVRAETNKEPSFIVDLFRYASAYLPAECPLLQYFVHCWCRYRITKPLHCKLKDPLPRELERRAAWWLSRDSKMDAQCFLEHKDDKEEYACPNNLHLMYIEKLKTAIAYSSKVKQTYQHLDSDGD